jgi:CubicO group peptidase (beta-lactamase class C family)
VDVQGYCDDRFASVADEFARNFAERGEVGASVSVTVGGETVVDLWGGHADPERSQPWEKDTIVNLQSCTKGVTALAAHLLASTGQLDFDEPVATYWPEFAAAGKEGVLVRHVLSHQVGLPALREPLKEGAFYDWDYMVERLAAEAPFWEPGTRHGYHAYTFGFLVGELIRRVSGRDFAEFVEAEIIRPLGLDLLIGVPESEFGRLATLIPAPMPQPGEPVSKFFLLAMTDPTSVPFLVLGNSGGYGMPGMANTLEARAAVIPATGGYSNARALAAMYRAIVHDRVIGSYPLDAEDIVKMSAVQSAATEDVVLSGPGRWTLGFHKTGTSPRGTAVPITVQLSEEAFCHTGAGGSIGLADPGCDMSFAYVMNQQAASMGLHTTGQSLVDATYRTLGYHKAKYDTWVK